VIRIRTGAAALAGACTLLLAAAQLEAQSASLRAQCVDASRAQVRLLCENVADAAVILQPRVGVALSGGNPVPGSASTLGMRLGTLPRVSLGLRVTAAAVGLPPVERIGVGNDVTFPVGSIGVDASMGLYQGMALLPTVGGLGSIDLLASAGVVPLPRGEGFDNGSAASWAAGARIGVLRESFTAPGISVDVLYRGVGDVVYGSEDLADRDAFLAVRDYRATSVRGTVGKRLFGFGLTGGVGHDWYRADVSARVRDATVAQPERVLQLQESNLRTSRTSVFGNFSLTILILNLATELGWQQGGTAVEGASGRVERGGLFGGVAVRLAI
jgi:hypothetical protein